MSDSAKKRDRTARLLRLQVLLWQYPQGIKVNEISRRFSIGRRTIYRDLLALESELGVPVWEDRGKRGIVEGYFLPPVTFTQAEAMNVFLAARLMQNYSYVYNPSVVATFMKLNIILPSHLRDQIQNTLDYLERLPRDERKLKNFNKLTEAWLTRHRVIMKYRELEVEEPVESIIEPYFIEPSLLSLSSYVIAYCRGKKAVRTFKMDHIIDAVVSSETYEIPSDFDARDYTSSAWDIHSSDKPESSETTEAVKLHFTPKIARAVAETIWHPSQAIAVQSDGSMTMSLRVRNTLSFRLWIMRWEKEVEVLEPEILRNQIAQMVKSLTEIYCKPEQKKKATLNEKRKPVNLNPLKSTDLTDEQWTRIAPLLPPKSRTGRPRVDARQTLNGILCVLKNKTAWGSLPRAYGAYSTCYTAFQAWQRRGIWDRIWEIVSQD